MQGGAPSIMADQIVLFHLSDVHIGTSLMPSPESFYRGMRSGYNAHDVRLFRPLERALADARRRVGLDDGEPLNLLISGDLTQSGTDNDYATAAALLHHRWQWGFGAPARWIGFGWPRDRTITVPGNHDHWRCEGRPTGFTRLAPDWFEATPWQRTIDSPSGALRLELFGVDSNSEWDDPAHPGRWNLFAGGGVSRDEWDRLAHKLSESSPRADPRRTVVRALVCHHAFSNAGGYFDASPLSETSRDDLCELAGRHDISAVLTGHTHAFDTRDWPVRRPDGRMRMLKELRCGTTLQGSARGPGLQGFWVHRIAKPAGSAEYRWTAWKYQAGAKFFDVDAYAPVIFTVPPG